MHKHAVLLERLERRCRHNDNDNDNDDDTGNDGIAWAMCWPGVFRVAPCRHFILLPFCGRRAEGMVFEVEVTTTADEITRYTPLLVVKAFFVRRVE